MGAKGPWRTWPTGGAGGAAVSGPNGPAWAGASLSPADESAAGFAGAAALGRCAAT